MGDVRRIGVLTGGGDAPGLNAVLRAVVRTAERAGGLETVGILDGFEGLLERRYLPLSGADVRDLVRKGGTILGTTNRTNPFAVRGADGAAHDRSREVLDNAREAGFGTVIVIGGDGSLKIALELGARGLPVVGVPKTIDNDLEATDYTFGFWTAIETATDALDRLRDTAESHHRVMVLEVMGRDAGWIALHAGLAGAADVILIPEIPYRIEAVEAKIEERAARGQGFSLVVVAEGATLGRRRAVVPRPPTPATAIRATAAPASGWRESSSRASSTRSASPSSATSSAAGRRCRSTASSPPASAAAPRSSPPPAATAAWSASGTGSSSTSRSPTPSTARSASTPPATSSPPPAPSASASATK